VLFNDDQVRDAVLVHELRRLAKAVLRGNGGNLRRSSAAGRLSFQALMGCHFDQVEVGDDAPDLRVVLGDISEANDAVDLMGGLISATVLSDVSSGQLSTPRFITSSTLVSPSRRVEAETPCVCP
jgi:hypothetical protein